MLWLRNHPYLAENCPCPDPILDYWLGISLLSPFHRLLRVLKAPEEQKHTLSASSFHLGLTMLPFVFPFHNLINSIYYHHPPQKKKLGTKPVHSA
jgi:hypothetical protein